MASRSFGICLRFAFVSMLAVWLAGCGLPPAVAIISTVADGISFVANGKSLSDVALSAMTDQDCAVYRIVSNNEICREATGDRRPAIVIVSYEAGDEFAGVGENPEDTLALGRGEPVLMASVADLTTNRALLKGFTDNTELFALVQDDGTLEVVAHDAARTDDRSNMRLIARISGYGASPETFLSLDLNGTTFAVEDIIV